jgi:hypothetical protein
MKLLHTMSPDVAQVGIDTPVSVFIGSDQYAGRVVRFTAATVTVSFGYSEDTRTFRPRVYRGARRLNEDGSWGPCYGWMSGPYHLRVGESETVLSREF